MLKAMVAFGTLVFGTFFPLVNLYAEEHAAAGASWAHPFGIGIGMALAVFGAATAQGRIAASFMDGVSRNPGAQKVLFVPLIIGMAFVETLVLFTFLVMNNLLGKF